MPLPEYPQTLVFLLLFWCLVALSLVCRCEAVFSECFRPFHLAAKERFGSKPSAVLILLVFFLFVAVTIWVGEGIGRLEIAVFSLWVIFYILVWLSSSSKWSSCPDPFDGKGSAPPHISRVKALCFSMFYGLGGFFVAFVLLAFSVALHRLIPVFQERCYIGDAWFFVKGSHFPISPISHLTLREALRHIFVAVPYFAVLCLMPLIGAAALFNIAVQLWPAFYRYRLLRSYVTVCFDFFPRNAQLAVWSELQQVCDFEKLRIIQRQKLLFLAFFVWVFGGLGFVLTFDSYAKVYTHGVAVNPILSFAEDYYPWSDAAELRFSAAPLGRASGFNAQVVLRLKSGREIKLWSYFVLADARTRRVGREYGTASTLDILKFLDIMRANKVRLVYEPLGEARSVLLAGYSDEEVKRSVSLVVEAFSAEKGGSEHQA